MNSRISEKPVLVTGGAGFLGSHLCERLLDQGNKVICLDNFYTGSEDNISHLINLPGFDVLQHDVCKPVDIDVSQIYNLACPASPVHYQRDPIQTTKTNVLGILNLLELAKKYSAKLFHTSTSEVYGDPVIHPQPESYWGNVNPNGIRSCYDEGKRCAESLILDYHRVHGIEVKIARVFNTYGPRMDVNDGRVVSNFIVQALKGAPLTVYGSGNQSRSFCYVSNLIDVFFSLMHSDKSITGPVNTGNPDEFTMLELASLIIELTDSASSISTLPLPEDDPKRRKPDITLATQLFGWTPDISLREGLLHTIHYFKEKLR